MSKDKKTIDETAAQAVESSEKFAENLANAQEEKKNTAEPVAAKKKPTENKQEAKPDSEKSAPAEQPQTVVKKGGSAIGLLALLVALGVGGAGYYFGSQELNTVKNEIQALKAQGVQTQTVEKVEMPTFEAEKAQLAELSKAYQAAQQQIANLSQEQTAYRNQINTLAAQVQRLSNIAPQADTSVWAFSDADFLLNNAVRKLVLDNDVSTTKSLLEEANNVLSKVLTPEASEVRNAIQSDLANLNSVNQVDQNALMLRLTNLANRLDDLPMIENESKTAAQNNNEVSDSIDDWQQNIEKTASSFLDHFIRISDRNKADEKAFVAPNQEVYLRENLRLRLQIAILAIPRQQNELYKKSLEAVGSWIRSYFDTKNENVKSFLKELDELSEQSIYVDAPTQLKSLTLLDAILKKAPQKVEKIQLEEEKDLAEPAKTPAAQAEAVPQPQQATEAKAAE